LATFIEAMAALYESLKNSPMLKGKKILIGITASIAAYKTILLIRLLVKEGAEVKVVMTPAAKDFVTPLTIGTLSKHKVLSDLFNEDEWANHVLLGRWADVMLMAPLSCNTLAKMANGYCDNLLMAIYLSATCPVVVAPAMDEDMWHHGSTKANFDKIRGFGNHIIPVNKGELASGLFGDGRMAEPEEILQFLKTQFFRTTELKGKQVLVTAGPTHEHLDPVRYIGNESTGKMGIAIAESFYLRGAAVTLVLGPTKERTAFDDIRTTHVKSAAEMFDAATKAFEASQIAVMSAAVADYTPLVKANEKIKKKDEGLSLELTKTKDILKRCGELKKSDQVLVGFALETNNEEDYARQKLTSKNADYIVMNSLRDAGAGFGHDTNKITIFDRDGGKTEFGLASKKQLAEEIVNIVTKKINE
jgi:phosphopantothenoylcysteine decarboxylase / phosphopantothenate---cysteine ligase